MQISTKELNEILADPMLAKSTLLIDVREHHEFCDRHLPNSFKIPLGELPRVVHKGYLPFDKKIIIICNTINRSNAAARYLKRQGYKNVFVVPGISNWNGLIEQDKDELTLRELIRGGERNVVYLDHASTTPVHSEVVAGINWALKEGFGNPSSIHYDGRIAKEAMVKARENVARLFKAKESEIIYTSGGTEANFLAIWGILEALPQERKHFVTSVIEHPSILAHLPRLQEKGYKVTVLPVDHYGAVNPKDLESILTKNVGLVSIMYANNEVGTIQPIEELAYLTHKHGAYFHTDLIQGLGFSGFLQSHERAIFDAASISGHKIYAPKGIGALFLKEGTPFLPLISGGGQENNLRSGTENMPGIIGFGIACELILEFQSKVQSVRELRDMLETTLKEEFGAKIYGHPSKRLANNLCFSLDDYPAHELVLDLDLEGVACSSGSACSGGKKPSHVIAALTNKQKAHAVRFSLSHQTTFDQINQVSEILRKLISFRRLLC
ncbi:MAG: aminotransferase class V-fold PLP-dependent enzyme [Firmicutes bacterium]|nr:aminotransferase class V-fold PLP-dependent enzyme [Bacillota bacterium]